MKHFLLALLPFFALPAAAAPFQPPVTINPGLIKFPELVATAARILSQNVKADGSSEYRLSVTVKNEGLASAPRFKLAAESTGNLSNPRAYFAIPLQPTGGAFAWYSYMDALAPGQSRTLALTAIFSKNFIAPPTFRIIVDSCSGEEFMPAYCRAAELDEYNNTSIAH